MPFIDLRSFLNILRQRNELCVIDSVVDPYLELAEIHRRIVAEEGPALLFTNVKGSDFPVVTNLFGTANRVDAAFGDEGRKFVEELARLPHEFFPFSIQRLWEKKGVFAKLTRLGIKTASSSDALSIVERPAKLSTLPVITSWKEDGGPFFTLPLVYSEHPELGVHNLGIYRMQVYDDSTTGMHMQIGKGGGFHLARAGELGKTLPVNVFLGGPPAVILSALAPLPENVPELIFASLLLSEKVRLAKNQEGPLPILADAEFVLVGSVDPKERQPEGPFGDHYGYYSLKHDFPVFRCSAVIRRKDAIYPATVVGKPRQEDYYLGNYLQDLLSPIFPVVMPAVKDLWSYGETGYHSLAAAVVRERYKREAMVSAFRILGEGQLSLTKFLLVVDRSLNLKNFREVWQHILERADFRTDLYIFSNLSMDTLDYTGPIINEGSKGVLLGMGEPKRRSLASEFSQNLPPILSSARVFCPGCLVISGASYKEKPNLAAEVASLNIFSGFPMIILADDVKFTTSSDANFLWSVFTRFEPAADIHCNHVALQRFHPLLSEPIVIDCRMKPNYPDELFCDEVTEDLVNRRWKEYFLNR